LEFAFAVAADSFFHFFDFPFGFPKKIILSFVTKKLCMQSFLVKNLLKCSGKLIYNNQ